MVSVKTSSSLKSSRTVTLSGKALPFKGECVGSWVEYIGVAAVGTYDVISGSEVVLPVEVPAHVDEISKKQTSQL